MNIQYSSAGRDVRLTFRSLTGVEGARDLARSRFAPSAGRRATAHMRAGPAKTDLGKTLEAVHSAFAKAQPAWNSIGEGDPRYMLSKDERTLLIASDSISVEGATKADVKRLRGAYGFEVIREGLQGKLLLRASETGAKALDLAQKAIAEMSARSGAKAAVSPHFLRVFYRPKPSTAGIARLWNHDNTGNPGLPGADVAAHAAWLITTGTQEVSVAVLDEGVDSAHPALRSVVAAERDFVGGNKHARPDGNDAHGTACAGIIGSQDKTYPGLAPGCRLVGVRIAKGDGNDGWIIDDFNTADAIDWSWDEGHADVLSNSWGGGPAVDGIVNAINRARTKGRKGKGSVVVFAAGNSNGPIQFPGSLDTVLTVGASTPWDERKSPVSKDGESWWGSCFGPALDLLAPGVRIATTDITGHAGYSGADFTDDFNGTSSAAPHVAAAAALALSVKPTLKEIEVREILTRTCDALIQGGKWSKEFGWGRLNIFSALRRARR